MRLGHSGRGGGPPEAAATQAGTRDGGPGPDKPSGRRGQVSAAPPGGTAPGRPAAGLATTTTAPSSDWTAVRPDSFSGRTTAPAGRLLPLDRYSGQTTAPPDRYLRNRPLVVRPDQRKRPASMSR